MYSSGEPPPPPPPFPTEEAAAELLLPLLPARCSELRPPLPTLPPPFFAFSIRRTATEKESVNLYNSENPVPPPPPLTLILEHLILLGNLVNVTLDVVVLLPHELNVLGGLLQNLRPRCLL